INLALKIQAVAHLHELVGIARVTILARKLAPPIWIDGPGKRHARRAAAVQDGTRWQSEVFDVVTFAQRDPLTGELGDADQGFTGRRFKKNWNGGKGLHSLFLRLCKQ